MTGRVWTEADIRALGVRTDLVTAASVLGIGRTTAYDLARRGEFPVRVLRLGAQYVVPVTPLLELLGVTTPGNSGAGSSTEPATTASIHVLAKEPEFHHGAPRPA